MASTIDNDLVGSEITIGVDTALNIALEAIDRLRVTASSHKRAFLVEVMGRNCGYLALMAGIAGGADSVLIQRSMSSPTTSREPCRRPTSAANACDGGRRRRGTTNASSWRGTSSEQSATGLRPTHDHPWPRAARRRRRRRTTGCWPRDSRPRRPSASIAASHGCLVGLHARRGADHAPRRGGPEPAKTINLKLLQLQKVLAQ